MRKVKFIVQHFALGLDPIVQEHRLHLRNDGPLDAKVRVAPLRGILRVAAPLVGDADPAGKANAAVYNQHFAVGAII